MQSVHVVKLTSKSSLHARLFELEGRRLQVDARMSGAPSATNTVHIARGDLRRAELEKLKLKLASDS